MRRVWLLFLISLTIISGCESAAYKLAMKNGSELMLQQKYKEAALAFSEALNEKKGDAKATKSLDEAKRALAYFNQLEASKRDIEKKDYPNAITKLNNLVVIEPQGTEDEKNIEIAKKLLDNTNRQISVEFQKLKEAYDGAQKVIDNKKYSDVSHYIEATKMIPYPTKEELEIINKIKELAEQATLKNWATYIGKWNTITVDENPWCNMYECIGAYEELVIKNVTDNKVKFSLETIGHRNGIVDSEGIIQKDGYIVFNFIDSWENKGNGRITLTGDKISVTTAITERDKMANWQIGEGTRDFYKSSDKKVVEAKKMQESIIARKEADLANNNLGGLTLEKFMSAFNEASNQSDEKSLKISEMKVNYYNNASNETFPVYETFFSNDLSISAIVKDPRSTEIESFLLHANITISTGLNDFAKLLNLFLNSIESDRDAKELISYSINSYTIYNKPNKFELNGKRYNYLITNTKGYTELYLEVDLN